MYVGNLPASATEAKLKELFEGPPLNCEVRWPPPASRCSGFEPCLLPVTASLLHTTLC